MRVNTFQPTPVLARANSNNAPAQEPAKEQQGQQPQAGQNQGQNPPDAMAQQIVDSLVSSPEFTKKALTKLGKGDELTIVVNDAEVIKVRNEGPTLTQKFLKGANSVFTAASSEAAHIVQADPAFAFKEAALGVRTQVESGIPSNMAGTLEDAFLPMLRIAALALDSKKAMDTWKNKDSSMLDKGVDTAHVVTDVVGLAGALGYKYIPALNAYAPTLTAIGLAGDVLSYSIHVLQYLRERGQVNLNEQQPPQQPQQFNIAGQNNNQANAA
ncbi:MAG: hypothetical protein KC910_07570 [Candidatus Eremiobacteraeota bacterium]|nr:hypothetical protein [Candidatus Eremiobacteraeota bacterium]